MRYYYRIRERYNNDELAIVERAACFIFHNKTCFNVSVSYRVNTSGKFNVPFGKYERPNIYDEELIMTDHKVLQKVDAMVQYLETSVINSPYLNLYLASQIHDADDALFTCGYKVNDLITVIGDVHHIFLKKYLIKKGMNEKSKYNQIANYTYLDTEVNKAVRDDSPNIYFSKVFEQFETGIAVYGNIIDKALLLKNLQQNCIPETILQMEYADYEKFVTERRKLMAKKIKRYCCSL